MEREYKTSREILEKAQELSSLIIDNCEGFSIFEIMLVTNILKESFKDSACK